MWPGISLGTHPGTGTLQEFLQILIILLSVIGAGDCCRSSYRDFLRISSTYYSIYFSRNFYYPMNFSLHYLRNSLRNFSWQFPQEFLQEYNMILFQGSLHKLVQLFLQVSLHEFLQNYAHSSIQESTKNYIKVFRKSSWNSFKTFPVVFHTFHKRFILEILLRFRQGF